MNNIRVIFSDKSQNIDLYCQMKGCRSDVYVLFEKNIFHFEAYTLDRLCADFAHSVSAGEPLVLTEPLVLVDDVVEEKIRMTLIKSFSGTIIDSLQPYTQINPNVHKDESSIVSLLQRSEQEYLAACEKLAVDYRAGKIQPVEPISIYLPQSMADRIIEGDNIFVKKGNNIFVVQVFALNTILKDFKAMIDADGFCEIKPNLILVKDLDRADIIRTLNEYNEWHFFEKRKSITNVVLNEFVKIQ